MKQHYFDVPFAFAGDVTAIPDPLQVGGTVSMTEGWNNNYQRNLSTDPAALPIDRSTTNWLLLQISTALQALQQASVPELILASQNGGAAYSYGQGAVVLWSASGNAPFVKYVSLTAGNTNTPSAADPQGLTTGWQTVVDPIATAAQASAGTNDASIMTPLKVAQQTALRALLAGSSSQVFNVGPATAGTHAPETLQVQQSAFNYAGTVTGTANALTAAIAPAPTSLTDGLTVAIRVATTNTGATTLNLNGLGAVAVVGAAHMALQGGELFATGLAIFTYSTSLTKWLLVDCTGGAQQVGNATASQQALPLGQATGRLLNIQVFSTAGSFVYTPTLGTTKCKVRMVGGGASGGGAAATGTSQCAVGGGGGAGAYAEAIFSVAALTGQTITVGAGGAAASASGNPGGTSSIGAVITAPGGNGGVVGSATTPPTATAGGFGGSGVTGSTVAGAGGSGSAGLVTALGNGVSGAGGSSPIAGGAGGQVGNANGISAGNAGAGGSGAINNSASQTAKGSGTGSAGIVIVEEYA